MEQELNLDEVMTRRFGLDTQINEMQARHKAELAPLAEEMALCESYIKTELLKSGAQQWKSSATGHMTYWITKDSVSMRNWEEFIAFIKDTGAWQLLNRAANKTAAKEMIEANTPPPGIEYVSFKDLAWRRGKAPK